MFLGLLATVAGWCSSSSNNRPTSPPPPPPLTSASAIVAESVTGSHVLTIKGYSRTKAGLGEYDSLTSCAFTVGGCRWSIEYFPDGRGDSNAGWISVYLHLDHSRGIDAHARFKFALLDGHGDGEPVPSHVYVHAGGEIQRFMCNGVPWGCDRFIRRRSLEQSPYLRDDCFRIRCDLTVYADIAKVDDAAFVAVPPPDMHRHLGRLLAGGGGEDTTTDVTFEVAGETVAAHRCILAARSPVFMAQLFGPMKEKASTCVRIADMEARVFRALLHFVYTDSLPPEMDDGGDADADDDEVASMAQHMLVAADRYGLVRLKLLLEHKLCRCIATSNVGTVLALAEQHGCNGLKNACFKFLMSDSKNLIAAIATDGFQHLRDSCPTIVNHLLAKRLSLTLPSGIEKHNGASSE